MEPVERTGDLVETMRRSRGPLFALMLFICCILVLTALQLQVLLSRDFPANEETAAQLVGKRRMQERFSKERPRYLALTTGDSSPLYASRLAEFVQFDWIQSKNPVLSAACSQSIIGEDAFVDIISVEYSSFDESLEILLGRLRKRFPDALILLLEVWNPLMLRYSSPEGLMTFSAWQQETGVKSGTLQVVSSKIVQSGSKNWVLPDRENKRRDTFLQEIGNVRVVSLPRPSMQDFSSAASILSYLAWFKDDNLAMLSPSGHGALATEVQTILPEGKLIPRSDRRGSWGSGDFCKFWLSTGNYGGLTDKGLQSGEASLELSLLRNDRVTVRNPFSTERMLYLTYMSAFEDGVYPRTRVRVNGKPTVQIEPFHDEEWKDHLARTTAVGFLPPGSSSVVQLDPLQHTNHQFRLVGVSLVADEIQGVPVDFSLEVGSIEIEGRRAKRFFGIW